MGNAVGAVFAMIVFWAVVGGGALAIGILAKLAMTIHRDGQTLRQPPAAPPSVFMCRACGSGPWDVLWADPTDPEFHDLCPNCSGAS